MFHLHHARGLEEQNVLILTDSSTNLDEGDIGLGCLGSGFDAANNFLGHMRHYLNAFTAVLKITFLFDHRLVNTTRGHVIDLGNVDVEIAFVGTNILISLIAIDSHKHFAVLNRIHRTSVHVDVRVDLNGCHLISLRFER